MLALHSRFYDSDLHGSVNNCYVGLELNDDIFDSDGNFAYEWVISVSCPMQMDRKFLIRVPTIRSQVVAAAARKLVIVAIKSLKVMVSPCTTDIVAMITYST